MAARGGLRGDREGACERRRLLAVKKESRDTLPAGRMLRYLKEAFWARPQLAGLGRVPWNALAVAGAVVLGFGAHAIWLGAFVLEMLYLYALAANARFRQLVDAQDRVPVEPAEQISRGARLELLTGAAREQIATLEHKVAQIDALYRENDCDEILLGSNRDALRSLVELYVRLLGLQRNLLRMGHADEQQIRSQIAGIEQALQTDGGSDSLRQSRQATLALLRQRLRNRERRDESLAEIASDLTRIETQIDLALEEASLKGSPSAISSSLGFVSQLLMDDDAMAAAAASTPPPSGAAARELED
jgi:hypothetical protein